MSTFGNVASVFSNWLNLTRETRILPAEDIINDAMQQTYLIGEMVKGVDPTSIVKAGKFISERIRLTNVGNYQHIVPGQERTPTRGTTVITWNGPWRWSENSMPYTEDEIELNGPGDMLACFKNFKTSLMTDLKSEHLNGMEADLWAVPDQGNMEAGSTGSGAVRPGLPYSIPTFITEAVTSGVPTGLPPANNGTFTTVEGISPATYPNWANPVGQYDPNDLGNENTGLFAAFSTVRRAVEFKIPGGYEKYMENDDLRKMKICTNADGQNVYEQRLAAVNDLTRAGPQDPAYGNPQYRGIPVEYIATLDTALLEQNPIGTYTTAAYAPGRPRYFFVNCKYIRPVYHPAHFMQETDPISGGMKQPDTYAIFVRSRWNLICLSRRRNGIVRPNA